MLPLKAPDGENWLGMIPHDCLGDTESSDSRFSLSASHERYDWLGEMDDAISVCY